MSGQNGLKITCSQPFPLSVMDYMYEKSQPINNANSDQNHTHIYHWDTTQNKLSGPMCFSSSGGNKYN